MTHDGLIRPLPVLLKTHAEKSPARVAFADDLRAVTYGELERRTGRLAAYLAHTGLRRGERVAICLGNCVGREHPGRRQGGGDRRPSQSPLVRRPGGPAHPARSVTRTPLGPAAEKFVRGHRDTPSVTIWADTRPTICSPPAPPSKRV